MSETSPRRQASKTAQAAPQPQQEQQQKGPHPSVLLKEVHEMLQLQGAQLEELISSEQSTNSAMREALKLQGAMLDDALAALQDLTSVVQTILLTLKRRQGSEVDQDEGDENEEVYDEEPEMAEAYDEEPEQEDQDDIVDQETAALPSSWMPEEEPEPESRRTAPRRRTTEAAPLTSESFASQTFAGPRPLILPTPSHVQNRKHQGGQA